jgi:hypothetical protein
MARALVNTRDDAGATGVTANDQEYLTVIPGMGIVSNVRGVLSASGHSPDVNSLGEVVYVRDVPNNTGQNIEQIFSTVRGQLTFINQFGFSSPDWPEIDNVGRTVFSMRAPNDIPNCQPSGCPAGTSENIWEIDTNGDLKQLTFFVFPEKGVQPTLAAVTGELVYVQNDETSGGVVSLVSDRDGVLFTSPPIRFPASKEQNR